MREDPVNSFGFDLRVFWDRKTGKIFGSEWVDIKDEGQTLSGKGFEAMEDLSVYTIFEVSGQFDEQTPNTP